MARILQRIVIVNQDIDISNRDDIEWAISSRVDRREKLHVYDDKLPSGGTIARLGIDATMDMANQVTQLRPVIPGAEKYQLDDYL
jgi:UbiD family decarboxylase